MAENVIRLRYEREDGVQQGIRYRSIGEPDLDTDGYPARWGSGSKPALYNLLELKRARREGYVVVVSSERDALTLAHHGVPAIAQPEPGAWDPAWTRKLDGIGTVYVVPTEDAEVTWVEGSGLSSRVRLVDLGEHESVNTLHKANPGGFSEDWRALSAGAASWAEHELGLRAARREELLDQCAELAEEEDVLACFAGDLRVSGYAGDTSEAELLYLAATSRLTDRPVSTAPKGQSSAGKNFLVSKVLDFFPESAYYVLTAMSERALIYSSEPLKHRVLVIYEMEGLGGTLTQSLLRTLLSEGHLRYEVTLWDDGNPHTILIEREGPTALFVTTTRLRLHPENETRILSLPVDDSPELTTQILLASTEEERPAVDFTRWHTYQEFLAAGDNRVTVPYRRELALLIPPVAVRLRRDFQTLLTLVRVHALLHQEQRERDEHGRVVAAFEDYAKVRKLLAAFLAYGLDQTVTPQVRETADAVERLLENPQEGVSVTELAAELGLDQATVRRRVYQALDRGFLKDLSGGGQGRPKRLTSDEPMPEDREVLPAVEQVREACTRARTSKGVAESPA